MFLRSSFRAKKIVKYGALGVLLLLAGLVVILAYPNKASAAILDDKEAQCRADYPGGGVWGVAWFVPSRITISPGQDVNIDIRTFVCNTSTGPIYNIKDYYGPSRVQETGLAGVIDYGSSGLPVVKRGGVNYRELDMGGFSAGQYKHKDFTVTVNGDKFGSGFTGCRDFHIAITGYGVVTWEKGKDPSMTNEADSILTLNVCRRVPDGDVNSSAEASCTEVRGTARDADSPSTQLRVQLYIDGDLKTTVNTSGASHTFNIDTRPYQDMYSHTFLVRILGVNSVGVGDGLDKDITLRVGPCIFNQPYLSIYGNDVLAGGGFDAGCVSTNGEIKARLRGDNAGAGAQLAVFALGTVNGFASAKLRDSGTPSRPNGLTFANTSDPPGYFGGTNCITNHPMKTSGQGITESNLSSWSGEYYKSGDINISGGNINKSTHVAVYVEGNLTITGDIQYTSPEPWNSMSDIPSIKFVVTGNIYIDSNVTRLDGTYVARPKDDGSAGTIYTCTDGSTTYTIDQLYNNCGGATNDKQLIVYGSFIASNIKWLRTFSTLKDADPSEHPNSPGNTNCDNKPICAAEVIISGPEMYINNRTKFIGGGNNTNVYDSITGLPPVL